MSDYFLFEFITNNFFKQFVEILNIIINQDETNSKNINLRMTKNAIYIIRLIKNEKLQYYIKLFFDKNSFKNYELNNELEIIFNGQTFIKACKNITKSNDDKIKIIYENSLLKIKIVNENKKKVETIILNNNPVTCFTPRDNILIIDIEFKNVFYKFNTIDFLNLKKTINLKNEIIQLKLFEDKFIEFETRSQGTLPFNVTYGDVDNDCKKTNLTINTKILNLLARLNILTNYVNIYQSLQDNIIKIEGHFMYPKNINVGGIEIIFCEKLN